MPRFTDQNTEGYSAEDLERLNVQFAREMERRDAVMSAMDDLARKSYEDHIAERVLADFDAQRQ